MPGAVEILPPSPALRASKLPDARIRDHAIRVAPLLDNFHVTWLEKEKDRWVQEGWITKAHKDALVTGVGFISSVKGMGSNRGSKRDIQDVYLMPPGATKPSLVVEGGAAHDEKEMVKDMKNWLKKGQNQVKKVILIIWIMLPGGIMGGRIEVYEMDEKKKNTVLVDEWIYVPEDPDSESQSVRLTLGELYSTKADRLPPHEREIIIDMQIEKLCDDAVEAIGSSNLQCADPDVGLWHFQNPQRLLASEKDGPGGGSGRSVNSHNTNGSYNTTIDNSNRAVQNFHFYHFPTSPTDFLTYMHNMMQKLPAFTADYPTMEAKARKFASNINPALRDLHLTQPDTFNLTKVALYDVIILCDDSGSMNLGNRNALLAETIYRILPVATRLNEAGVSLRFINYNQDREFNDLTSQPQVAKTLRMVSPAGTTRIGTVLRHKIVKPILAKARANTLVSPVLVVIVTDGEPSREPLDTLKNTIISCKHDLDEITNASGSAYGRSSVVFQLSHVGDNADAEQFVHSLSVDPELEGMVYCNLKKLDEQLASGSSATKNRSLLELLSVAINRS